MDGGEKSAWVGGLVLQQKDLKGRNGLFCGEEETWREEKGRGGVEGGRGNEQQG